MKSRFLFINCGHTGISGDLLLAGLGSIVGLDTLKEYLEKILSQNSHLQNYSIEFETKVSHGIAGIHLLLDLEKGSDHDSHHMEIAETEENSEDQPHDHYDLDDFQADLTNALSVYDFSPIAKDFAFAAMNEIMAAEAAVHNIPLEQVHLHEIGSIDTIVDIAGTTFCLQQLGAFDEEMPLKIYSTPIAVGGGTVTFSHGTLPVPAPATLKILEANELAFQYGPVDTELATPTGVSLLAVMKKTLNAVQSKPEGGFEIQQSGIGVGTKDLEGYANILQCFLGLFPQISSTSSESNEDFISEPINVLETNVDDVRGELLGNLIPLLISQGAFDVSIIPCTTKKNRPGYLIKVIASLDKTQSLVSTIIQETGTLGVRVATETRFCLQRDVIMQEIELEGQHFEVHIKRAFSPSQHEIVKQKIEFDDLKQISESLSIPIRLIEMKIWEILAKFS